MICQLNYATEKTPSLPRGYRMTLFCPGKDAEKEKWDGPRCVESMNRWRPTHLAVSTCRTSLEDAASIFRADYAMLITSFSSHLRSTLPNFSNIFVDKPESHRRGQATRRSSRATSKSILKYLWSTQDLHESDCDHILGNITGSKCKSLSNEVARLRIIKSPAEQGVMRAAACISGRAHAKVCIFSIFLICFAESSFIDDGFHPARPV
jgi:intermediate cleaving peptidase 55